MARDVSHIELCLCVLYPLAVHGQMTAWSGDADDTLHAAKDPSFSFSFSVEAYIRTDLA